MYSLDKAPSLRLKMYADPPRALLSYRLRFLGRKTSCIRVMNTKGQKCAPFSTLHTHLYVVSRYKLKILRVMVKCPIGPVSSDEACTRPSQCTHTLTPLNKDNKDRKGANGT